MTTYDNSHLVENGSCTGDSIRFVIKNTGSNMSCFMPTRLYLNNVLQNLDSLKLNANDSLVKTFLSDGKTWRLETEQHPLHPGNSHPNVTVEACGDSALVANNWTSGLVTTNFPIKKQGLKIINQIIENYYDKIVLFENS